MDIEDCFKLKRINLFPEFIEWLVTEPDRKLVNKTWLLMTTTDGSEKKHQASIGSKFVLSDDEADWKKMITQYVDYWWPNYPDNLAKAEVEKMTNSKKNSIVVYWRKISRYPRI